MLRKMHRRKWRNRAPRVRAAFWAGAVCAGLASGAGADPLLASDPDSFTGFFFDQGMPAMLSASDNGDPLIEFRHEGRTHPLFFNDCLNNTGCLSVQFYAGYDLGAPFPLEKLNEWNSGEHRFMRAYSTPDTGRVHLEMDIATSKDGISGRDFEDLLRLWLDRVGQFEGFIGW